VVYILLTTAMNLIWTGEISDRISIQDLREILNSTFSKFYNPSEYLTVEEVTVSFKGRVIQTEHTKETKMFNHPNPQIFSRLDSRMTWKYTWGRTDRARHSVTAKKKRGERTGVEDTRMRPQFAHGQFLSRPWTIWWLGQQTDLLLGSCQTEQKRHATRPSTKDTKSENGRHSLKNHGWLDGNTVAGLERHVHAYEYSQCHRETSLLQWGRERPKAANCDGM
jgi:hypothetical protein